MSMVFAGFMGAAREDRLIDEKRRAEEKAQAEARKHDMNQLTKSHELALARDNASFYREQKKKDRELEEATDRALAAAGLGPEYRPQVSNHVKTHGADGFLDLYTKGRIRFDQQVAAGSGIDWGKGSTYKPMFDDASAQYNLPEGYLYTVAGLESGFDPGVKNKAGSPALGLVQFMPATAAQYGVTDRTDPNQSIYGGARFSSENWGALRMSLGRDVSPGELYLAHQQGAGGASKLLKNPNSRAADLIGLKAVQQNLPSEYRAQAGSMSAGEFTQLWEQKFNKFYAEAGYGGDTSAPVMSARQSNPGQAGTSSVTGETPAYAAPTVATTGNDGWRVLRDDEMPVDPKDDYYPSELQKAQTPEELDGLIARTEADTSIPAPIRTARLAELRRSKRDIVERKTDEEFATFVEQTVDPALVESKIAALSVDPRLTESQKDLRRSVLTDRLSVLRAAKEDEDGDDFATLIRGATTQRDLVGLKTSLTEMDLDPAERKRYNKRIDDQMLEIVRIDSQKAKEEQEPMLWMPYASNGTLDQTGQKMVQWDGQNWVTRSGEQVDISKGINPISTDAPMDFVKLHNTRLQDLSEYVQNGTQATNSVLTLRESVIENPAAINEFVQLGNNIDNLVADVREAVTSMSGEYNKDRIDGVLDTYGLLGTGAGEILQNFHMAAYSMGKVQGSTGQALSDKEFDNFLRALGNKESDPKRLVGLLNNLLKNHIVAQTEANRYVGWTDAKTGFAESSVFEKASYAQPFGQFYREFAGQFDQSGAKLQQFNEAMSGKTDYPYEDNVTNGLYERQVQETLPGMGDDTAETEQAPMTENDVLTTLSSGGRVQITDEMWATMPQLREAAEAAGLNPGDYMEMGQ